MIVFVLESRYQYESGYILGAYDSPELADRAWDEWSQTEGKGLSGVKNVTPCILNGEAAI